MAALIIQGNFGRETPQPQASLISPYPAPRWAELVQMGDWQRMGIVDPERAARMTERDLVNYVVSCREESAAAQAQLLPYWDYYDDLYNLRTWDSEKQDWQAQIVVPEVRTKVRVALSQIQAGLLDPHQFFKTVNEAHPYDDDVVQFIQRVLMIVQENAGLLEAYLSALEDGLLFGSGCMGIESLDYIDRRPHVQTPTPQQMQQWQMMAWQASQMGQPPPPPPQPFVEVEPERRNRVVWKHKLLRSMFPDPFATDFYSGKYVVEESEADEDDLINLVQAGIYDSLDDIGEPIGARSERDYRARRTDLAVNQRTMRRRHGVMKFTGNIYDKDGHIVAENWVIHVVNERAVALVGPNPLWSGKKPYIWTTPLPFRGRVWGRSLVDADAHVQVAVTNYLNLALDDLKYVVLGVFNCDMSLLDEPSAPDSVEPGMVVKSRGGAALSKIQFNTSSNQMWPMIRELFDLGGKSTQIGEWADGTPTSRGRPTKAEVMTKTSAGTAYVHGVTKNLERNDLEPALELTKEFVVQFGVDSSEPRMQQLLQEFGGPQLFANPIARLDLLDRPYRIKVGGISMLMNRESIIDRTIQLAQLTMQMGLPPPNQIDVLYTIISALGFSPDQFRYPPTPQAFEQMMFAMQQQQAQAGMAGGPGPGAPPEVARANPSGGPTAPSQAPPNPNVGMPPQVAA